MSQPMSPAEGPGHKTLAIRLDLPLHAQLSVIAQLRGNTITDEIRQAIEHHVEIASAQVKSALLLAALNAPGRSRISQSALTRDHTERMLTAFGAEIAVEMLPGGGEAVHVMGEAELRRGAQAVPDEREREQARAHQEKIDALVACLRSFGPNSLLWVTLPHRDASWRGGLGEIEDVLDARAQRIAFRKALGFVRRVGHEHVPRHRPV